MLGGNKTTRPDSETRFSEEWLLLTLDECLLRSDSLCFHLNIVSDLPYHTQKLRNAPSQNMESSPM